MKRVLVIGMFDSIHFARWLAQFRDERIDFLLFPSSPHRRIHSNLHTLLRETSVANFSLARFTRFAGLPMWVLDRAFRNKLRGFLVSSAMRAFSPHYIHALEFQNAGYIALEALKKVKPKDVKLIVTNYGSDIFWFRRFPKHLMRIKQLLAIADFYACECSRDVSLARELGFKGTIMPVRPNAGGLGREILSRAPSPINERNVLAVKGYHGWVGKAHNALKAIELIQAELKDFEIVVYSCNWSTLRMAKKVSRNSGLKITSHAKGKLAHFDVLKLLASSIVYVGVSESDGISTSLVEAMAMGAIPVQTSTACCDEWFDQTGVALAGFSEEEIGEGILKAIELAKDPVNRLINWETVRANAAEDHVKASAVLFYS